MTRIKASVNHTDNLTLDVYENGEFTIGTSFPIREDIAEFLRNWLADIEQEISE